MSSVPDKALQPQDYLCVFASSNYEHIPLLQRVKYYKAHY